MKLKLLAMFACCALVMAAPARAQAPPKPLFAANHRWAMAQGEASLTLELARRRATSDAARRVIPPPPGPITYAGVALIGASVAAAAGAFYLLRRATRRSRRRDLSIR